MRPLGGEERLAELGPQPALGDHGGDGVHREVVVGEAGHPGPDHLGAGEPRPQLDVPLHEVGLDGPDHVVEPLLDGQVLGDPAQRDHRSVGVAVDQPRHRDLPASVDPLHRSSVHHLSGIRDALDDAVPYDDRRILPEPGPFLIVVHEDGASGDDEIRDGRRHTANVRRRTGAV